MNQKSVRGRSGWLEDEIRFLRTWLARPRIIGAIAPSGRALARAMAAAVDPATPGLILELGPGTGVVTEALIARGIAPERIVAVEFDSGFCAYLRRRFPRVTVLEGDAFAVDRVLPPDKRGPFAAVVSSLPLVLRPPAERRRLVEDMLARLPPGGRYIQFSYSPRPPVPAAPGVFSAEHGPWIVGNLPPARVWTYRRAA
jgi:phosphatidylethanolamine/phosphatidyl-N-methylethanolamine N-methyltransferase